MFRRYAGSSRYAVALAAALTLGGCLLRGSNDVPPSLPAAELIAAVAPGEIIGLVTDAHSGAPLADVVMRLTPTGPEAVTDASGRFRLTPVAAGSYRIRVRRVGYQPRADSLAVPPGSGAAVVVRLTRSPVRLEYIATDDTSRR